jgi:hypothetical protein
VAFNRQSIKNLNEWDAWKSAYEAATEGRKKLDKAYGKGK